MTTTTTTRRSYGTGSVYQRQDDGTYVASMRYIDTNGARRRITRRCDSEQDARRVLRQLLRTDPNELRPVHVAAPVDVVTVASWWSTWSSTTLEASSRRPATIATYRTLARTCLLPVLGDVPLGDLSTTVVDRWVIGLRVAGRAASTIRQAHVVLGLLTAAAVDHKLIERDPVAAGSRPAAGSRSELVFSPEQVAAILDAAHGRPAPVRPVRLAVLFDLIAYTGVRKGEALGLRWSDVDLDTGVARITGTLTRAPGGGLVRQDATKTRSGQRAVPLVPDLVDELRTWRRTQAADRLRAGTAWRGGDYIFTIEDGGPVDPRGILRVFDLVRACAGVDVGSLHTLRHSAATQMLAHGVPMPVVSAVLGHSSISVTVDLYGHVAPAAHVDQVAAALAAYAVPAANSAAKSRPTRTDTGRT